MALVALTIAAPLIISWWIGMRWETNDDPMMKAIADGTLSGRPSYRVPFSESLVGVTLWGLYRAVPNVGWYGWHLTVVVLGAAFSLCRQLLLLVPDRSRIWAAIPVAGLALVSTVPILVFQQFTTASAMALTAGLALATGPERTGRHMLLAGGFLSVGYLIRPEMFQLSLLIWAPIIVLQLSPRAARERIVAAVVAVILAANAVAGALIARSDPTYVEWQQFNAARGELHNVQTAPSPEAVADVGLTALEWRLFHHWSFWDADTFTTGRLAALADEPEQTFQLRDLSRLATVLDRLTISSDPRRDLVVLLLLALAVATPALLLAGNRRAAAGLAGSLITTIATFSYLETHLRLPSRVTFGVLLQLLWFASVQLTHRTTAATVQREPPRPPLPVALRQVTAGIACLAVLVTVLGWRTEPGPNNLDRKAAFYEALEAESGVAVVLQGPNRLLTQAQSPLRSRSLLPDNVIALGWAIRHPDWEARLHRLGIDDLGRAIAEDPAVVLESDPALSWDRNTGAYLALRYQTGSVLFPSTSMHWPRARFTVGLVEGRLDDHTVIEQRWSGEQHLHRLETLNIECGAGCGETVEIGDRLGTCGLLYHFESGGELVDITDPSTGTNRCSVPSSYLTGGNSPIALITPDGGWLLRRTSTST